MKLIYKVTYYKIIPNFATGHDRDTECDVYVACRDVKNIFKQFDRLKSVEFICEVTQEM